MAETVAKALGCSADIVGGAKIIIASGVVYVIGKGANLLRKIWLGDFCVFKIYMWGEKTMKTENEELIDDIAESKIKLFVGENADYYLEKWKSADDPKKKSGWNWAAFLGGILWLGYRKMYALIMQLIGLFFVFNIIGFFTGEDLTANVGLVLAGILGVLGNSLYYKHMLKKIKSINEKFPDFERENKELKKAGGRSWGGVGITVLIILIYATISAYIFG